MLSGKLKVLDGAPDLDYLNGLIQSQKNLHVLKVLFFLKDLYGYLTVPEACEKHDISLETGYKYVKVWREKGVVGLIPNYGDGRPSKLNKDQEKVLKKEIVNGNIVSANEIKDFIKFNFNIKMSDAWISNFKKKAGIKKYMKRNTNIKIDKSKNQNIKKKNIDGKSIEFVMVSKKHFLLKYDEIKQLDELIKKEKNDKLLKRYIFINALNKGLKLKEAGLIVNFSYSTNIRVLKAWNNQKINGLSIEWGEGRKPSLTKKQNNELYENIKNHELNSYSKIHKFILENYQVDFSLKYLNEYVKKNFNLTMENHCHTTSINH